MLDAISDSASARSDAIRFCAYDTATPATATASAGPAFANTLPTAIIRNAARFICVGSWFAGESSLEW